MDVNPILSAASGGAPTGGSAVGKTLDGFGQSLLDATRSLDELQKTADASALDLATGQPVDLHDVMLAQTRASLGLNLAVQVRNKLVEAYQDVMRMQL